MTTPPAGTGAGRKAPRVRRLRDDADAAMHREGAAPVRPELRLLRHVLDDLLAREVRRLRVERELADELHAGRLVRLAREPHRARTDGFRLPFAGPERVTLGDEILRPDIEAPRAGRRFRN